MREQPKFDRVRCLALFRCVLFQVGQELVTLGLISPVATMSQAYVLIL